MIINIMPTLLWVFFIYTSEPAFFYIYEVIILIAVNEELPEPYKYEKGYRKIRREYLNSNIAKIEVRLSGNHSLYILSFLKSYYIQ